jgi:hypothetical protein
MQYTKPCLQCGQTIIKPQNESREAWEKRHKFCSRSCSAIYRQPGKLNEFTKERHFVPVSAYKKGQHASPGTEFKKGIIPWSKLHPEKMPTPWNKGTKGLMPSVWNKGLRYSKFPKSVCQVCKKEFQPKVHAHANKYCSRDCMRLGFRKGDLLPCLNCQKDFYVAAHWEGRKKFCSKKCQYNYKVGENSSNWKDGATKLNWAIRNSRRYLKWKKQIRQRDGKNCILCGSSINTCVDHFPKSFLQILKEFNITTTKEAYKCEVLWDISKGRLICNDCHRKTDTYGTKAIKLLTRK